MIFMTKDYQTGNIEYTPYFIVDGETGELIPLHLPKDAVTPTARFGNKVGNPY
jgi:hypothetical protein